MKKGIFPFKSEKNVQVQLKSFGYINAETKLKKQTFPLSNLKKFTVTCRNNRNSKKKPFLSFQNRIKIYNSS